MNVSSRRVRFVAACLSLGLGACGGGDGSGGAGTPPPPVQIGIGPAGGTVLGPNGARVVIPAGALTTNTGGPLAIDFFGFTDITESVAMQSDSRIVLGGLARENVDGYGLARVLP